MLKKISTITTSILNTVEFSITLTIIIFILTASVHAMEFEIDEESFILGENYTNLILESSNEDKFLNTNTNTAINLLIINSLIDMTKNNQADMEDLIDGEPLVNHIRNLIYSDKASSKDAIINYYTEEKLLSQIKKSYIYNKMIDTNIYSLKDINRDSSAFEYEHDGRVNKSTLNDLFTLCSYMFKESDVLNNLFEQKGYYSKKKQAYIKNSLPKKLAQNIKAFSIEKNENGSYNYILKCRNFTYIVEDKKSFEDACNSLIEKNPEKYTFKKELYKEKIFNISKIPFLTRKAEVSEKIYLPKGTSWKKKLIIDKNYKNNKFSKNYIGYLNIYNDNYSLFYPLRKVRWHQFE